MKKSKFGGENSPRKFFLIQRIQKSISAHRSECSLNFWSLNYSKNLSLCQIVIIVGVNLLYYIEFESIQSILMTVTVLNLAFKSPNPWKILWIYTIKLYDMIVYQVFNIKQSPPKLKKQLHTPCGAFKLLNPEICGLWQSIFVHRSLQLPYGQCIGLFPSQNKCIFICGKCQGSWHYLCHILCIWRGQQWAWSWLQLFHDYVHIEWKYKILEILAICNTLKCLHQLTTKFTYWCKIASQCSEHVCLLPQGRGSLRNTFTCQPPREESPYTKKTWWHQIWHSLLMCYRSLLMS